MKKFPVYSKNRLVKKFLLYSKNRLVKNQYIRLATVPFLMKTGSIGKEQSGGGGALCQNVESLVLQNGGSSNSNQISPSIAAGDEQSVTMADNSSRPVRERKKPQWYGTYAAALCNQR